MTLKEYYHTTMTEYYLKVEAFNDRYYRELDSIRRIQYDIRCYSQMSKKCKPKNLSDIIRLPFDKKEKKKKIPVTQAEVDAVAKMGYMLVNPLKN